MDRTELVLGRGEVYFNRFLPGTRTGEGERYIGNTPILTIDRKTQFASAMQSRSGVVSKSVKELVRSEMVLTFVTDNISDQNVADWMGADVESVSIARMGPQSESHVLVPGRWYQLGLQQFPMIGVRNIWALGVRIGQTFVRGLYEDLPNGRFGVPLSRTDLNGQTAICEYEVRNSTSKSIVGNPKTVKGSLRFIGRNAVGQDSNYFFPQVVIAPRDQVQLKGDEWRTLAFEAESLEQMVIYGAGRAGRSPGELALIAEGLATDGFVILEGQLHQIVNGA